MHILIIEDEEQLCRSVAEGLRIDGYETDICFDGDEGLCLCMTENYDLILLDLNLPGMDGLEILRQFHVISSKFDLICCCINQNTFQNWHSCFGWYSF